MATAETRPYVQPGDARFDRLRDFVDHVVQPTGFAYKDVSQPFVVEAWSRQRESIRFVRIRRPLADVALAMRQMSWTYPSHAAPSSLHEPDDRLLSGLARAWRALESIPATEIDYDRIIDDADVLTTTLRSLYPDHDVAAVPPWNDAFRQRTQQVLARRDTSIWRQLDARLQTLGGE